MFVKELPVYDNEYALLQHIEQSHPLCQFCNVRFYTSEELYSHMMAEHFVCHLCQQGGVDHQYYASMFEYEEHLR